MVQPPGFLEPPPATKGTELLRIIEGGNAFALVSHYNLRVWERGDEVLQPPSLDNRANYSLLLNPANIADLRLDANYG